MMSIPGLEEFQPGDVEAWPDDSATTLLRQQKAPAGALARLDAEINRTIGEMQRGEYPHKTFARLGIIKGNGNGVS
jgi:hypothetical protein